MDTTEAMRLVREFRSRTGEGYEVFARRIGCGLQTITRWEKTRTPEILSIQRLAHVAGQMGFKDLARGFNQEADKILRAARVSFIGRK
jgi:transcriptional regulator with XRE-family HTH domain